MNQPKDFLERLRIASPCNVGWESMAGDDRTRFCEQCGLHVYNISRMTGDEVASLVRNTEGRICARLYRRADGTVLTRDCPVGLRAFRRRVAKVAGAALTAVLGLFAAAAGQSKSQEGKTCTAEMDVKLKREAARDGRSALIGTVLDPNGAVLPGAKIRLSNEQTGKKLTAVSTDSGEFKFGGLAAGKYLLEIESEGFKNHKIVDLVIKPEEVVRLSATLELAGEVLVGVVGIESPPDQPGGATTIEGNAIKNLPLP